MKTKTNRPRAHRRALPRPAEAALRHQTARRRLYTDFLALAFYPGMRTRGEDSAA